MYLIVASYKQLNYFKEHYKAKVVDIRKQGRDFKHLNKYTITNNITGGKLCIHNKNVN